MRTTRPVNPRSCPGDSVVMYAEPYTLVPLIADTAINSELMAFAHPLSTWFENVAHVA